MANRSEYESYGSGTSGAGWVRSHIEQSIGKTIKRIEFGPQPSTSKKEHHGEWLILHFDDGSQLELGLGSNAAQLPNGVLASDVSLSFMATYLNKADAETGERDRFFPSRSK